MVVGNSFGMQFRRWAVLGGCRRQRPASQHCFNWRRCCGLAPVVAGSVILVKAACAYVVCPPPAPVRFGCSSHLGDARVDSLQVIFEDLIDLVLVVHQADQRKSKGDETHMTLALFESLRVAACVDTHRLCFVSLDAARSAEITVCSVIKSQWTRLRDVGAPKSTVLEPLQQHGCFGGEWGQTSRDITEDVMKAAAQFLLKVTRVDTDAYARCLPSQEDWSPPIEFGIRTEGTWSDASRSDATCPVGVVRGQDLRSAPLLYPRELAPSGLCDAARLLRKWSRQQLHDVVAQPSQSLIADVSGRYSGLHIAVPELLELLERSGVRLSRFVVNLGASDGRCTPGALYDPANCLMLMHGFGGVAFEGREDDFIKLAKRFSSRTDIHLRFGWATPELAAAYAGEVTPRSPDLLKVDVDNCDSCFVEAMLDRFDPKLIHVEIEADLPPSLLRRSPFVKPKESETTDGPPRPHGLPGSLGAFLVATQPRYRLLHVEFLNAVFVRADLVVHVDTGFPAAGLTDNERWELGYFCHPLRTTHRHSPDVRLRKLKRVDASQLANPAVSLAERLRLAASLVDATDPMGTDVRLTAPSSSSS
eukprot:TRINITY_DN16906_c0_g1_i1.p1 TRINITY_DN16906_c0_g1~~TRINITY_DN16906_c0_g1_i1.p1  ORF type:complete len:590 (+),score=66.69 TRINITY_DN16906_c0_g1_i1:163-1932(+)